MVHKIRQVFRYLNYLLTAKTKYGIHSPFVYSLVTEVLEDRHVPTECLKIRALRKQLCQSKRLLEVTDFGSGKGSRPYTLHLKTVGQIGARSSVDHASGELLHRLVARFKPENILELGTSLGISTLYLATAEPRAKVITIEGCSTTSEVARENFADFGLQNIEMLTGRFEDILPEVLKRTGTVDFAYIDGHHEYEPTKKYVEMILRKISENSVVVIDDIHWSAGMEKAWKEVCSFAQVKISVDVFRFGMLFFREGLTKQHFVIR
jgi:predicted O-methyltransferase YrrM